MWQAVLRLWDSPKNTPSNFITLTRIVPLAPLAFWLLIEGETMYAAWVVAFAGITDWLDGWLARLLKQETLFGRVFDPLADKVFVDMVLFGFWIMGFLSWIWVVVLVTIAYDIRMTYLRLPDFRQATSSSGNGTDSLSPSWLGKSKTALQFAAMFLILMSDEVWLNHVGQTLLASTIPMIAVNWMNCGKGQNKVPTEKS